MLELLAGIGIVLICIACEGFFSGTETAMVSVDRARIRALADQGSRRAAMVDHLLATPENFFSTTLLGTNMAVVLCNAVATFLVIKFLGERYEFMTIVIMTPLILVFGEIVPKTIYRYHAEQLAIRLVYPFRLIAAVLYPVVAVLSGLTRLLVRPFGLASARMRPHTTREDMENYLAMWHSAGSFKTAEKKIIERIFDFAETTVNDIMVRIENVEAVEINDGIAKAIRLVQKTGYSRIPVYEGDVYSIVGSVHAFDLLTGKARVGDLRDVMRPARYVPDAMLIDDLLRQMQTEGLSLAVVVNEYGGTTGIITIEDILEEVVGEIYDEHDKEESFIIKAGRDRYIVNARMAVDDLNDHLKLDLPKDDYETVAGFLLKYMQRVPKIGESFQYGNSRFVIRQADERSVKQVVITIKKTDDHEAKND